MLTIRLGNGDLVPVRAYVAAWRRAKEAAPDLVFRFGPATWWPVSAAECVAQFRDGLHDRINRHLPGYGHGRKWSDDWQRAAILTARKVNTPLLVVRYAPPELRARLAHRLTVE